MAALLKKIGSSSAFVTTLSKKFTNSSIKYLSVYTESGGISKKPTQVKFGLIKAFATVFPFLYLGATISKNGAAFLEENDIFVPDDDDD